jgi:hypothetical protein
VDSGERSGSPNYSPLRRGSSEPLFVDGLRHEIDGKSFIEIKVRPTFV